MINDKENKLKLKQVNQKISSYAEAVSKSKKDLEKYHSNMEEKNDHLKKSLNESKSIINRLSEIIINQREEMQKQNLKLTEFKEKLAEYDEKLENSANITNILLKKIESIIKTENLIAIITDCIVKTKPLSSPDEILTTIIQSYNRKSGSNQQIFMEQIRQILVNPGKSH